MICIICKQEELQVGTGSSLFERDGMTLVIKGVPKLICPNCREEYTDEETTERLLDIVEEAERNGVLSFVW
jgi:YgiT-type zinc finger domain-containing protein